MQAAELLAIIVPGTPGQAGAPGLAKGVGMPGAGKAGVGKTGVGKAGEGLFADASTGEGEDAAAVNPFAQALAALMAAPGQGVVPAAVADGQPPGGQPGADATAEPPNKGLQTAMAATAKAGAPAYGLARLLADAGAPTETTEPSGETAPQGEATVPAAAQDLAKTLAQNLAPTDKAAPTTTPTVAQTDKTLPQTDNTFPQDGQTPPATAKTLPATAQADEALARRLASPPPRSERADAVANGPHLPPCASPPAPPAATTAPASMGAPATGQASGLQTANPLTPDTKPAEVAAAPSQPDSQVGADAAPSGDEPPAALALAATETGGSTSAKPATPPRAEGRALGKVEAKDKVGDDPASDHRAEGVGRGLATAPGQLKKTESEGTDADAPAIEPKLAKADAAGAPADGSNLPLAEPARGAAAAPAPGDTGKLAAHTVAHLAEQIVSKSDGKATRFDVQLDPAGLGKVDVRIEIGRGGEISAAMTFDNPVAAAEMRTRAGELRSALEQAGFDLGKGGLSFDFSGQNPGRNLWDQTPEAPRPSWARGAFTDLAALADTPSPARWRQIDADSVDVTV